MAAGEITLDYDFLLDDSDPTFLKIYPSCLKVLHTLVLALSRAPASPSAHCVSEIKGRSTLGITSGEFQTVLRLPSSGCAPKLEFSESLGEG